MDHRARWELALTEGRVGVFGPPAWLVGEEKRGGEEPHETARRLRQELGLDVPTEAPIVPTNVPTPAVVPTPNGDMCDTCGEKPREGRYRECARCRKAKQRKD